MLTSKYEGAEVKIIDFGLAKLLYDNKTTSFLGTRVSTESAVLFCRTFHVGS